MSINKKCLREVGNRYVCAGCGIKIDRVKLGTHICKRIKQ